MTAADASHGHRHAPDEPPADGPRDEAEIAAYEAVRAELDEQEDRR